ncbi:DNA-binding response regulator [Terasakiella brassicae]|uniref:DNA-binding response regulator n=1 Tax=Terasakiella brassicae TaxID=1634917 RepID=A0A917C9E8_9PROT|nr:response regulator transcription factor [Terasakiella brassicae]GGF76079.1 DNA-binding response regulator [Terasakiella brassicae]
MNILIVEDRPSVAQAIAQCFDGVDYVTAVKIAHNFEAATARIRKKHYDVFLLDINLDGSRNGLELCKHIRQTNKDSLIVFISGFIQDDILDQLYGVGANDFIRKPFVRKEIRLKVVHWWNFIKAGRTKKPCLEYHGMSYALERSVFKIEGKTIPLTKALRRLLILFLQSPETIIPYSRIQQEIWGDHDTCLKQRDFKGRIFELRKRLPVSHKDWIKSEAGEGYILRKELN